MRYKIDLHTHSIISYDGGITRDQYKAIFKKGLLDFVAITDHNETAFAFDMRKEFGEKIVVGEEISTKEGEIIGLFLRETIPQGLSAEETAKLIHEQGGIVYVPHPFETLRNGVQRDVLENIVDSIDIIEVFNARSRWRGKDIESLAFAKKYTKAMASSSDGHCRIGIGSSFAIIDGVPTRDTIMKLLTNGTLEMHFAPVISYLCPAVNKLLKRSQKSMGY